MVEIIFVFVLIAIVIALVPSGWEFMAFKKLESSLTDRFGPLWSKQSSLIDAALGSDPKERINDIELRFGSELTEYERSLLDLSRRQNKIGKRWRLSVWLALALVLLVTLTTFN